MALSWDEVRVELLTEPKAPVRGVYEEPGSEFERVAVIHDGGAAWVVSNGRRGVVDDGSRAVSIGPDGVQRFRSRELYSFGRVKALLHPRLFSPLPRRAQASDEGTIAGHSCVAFTVAVKGEQVRWWVDVDYGFVIAMEAEDHRAGFTELTVTDPPDPGFFAWTEAVDLDHTLES